MTVFRLVLLVFIFSSCSAQWHLKKAIKKDPLILVKDTVIVTDTLITEPTVVQDTLTISEVDTVEIVKNNFKVKIVRSYDTLIVDGGCEADTIVRKIEVPVEKVVYHEHDKWYHKMYRGSFWILLLIIGAFFIQSRFKK